MPTVEASADLMSPLHLFLQADAVVKAVMIGLLLASVWTWAIIFTHSIRLKRINRGTDRFERDFWATNDIDQRRNVDLRHRRTAAAVTGRGGKVCGHQCPEATSTSSSRLKVAWKRSAKRLSLASRRSRP